LISVAHGLKLTIHNEGVTGTQFFNIILDNLVTSSLHVISLSPLLQPWYVSTFDILIAVELSVMCINSIWISRSSTSWI